jgi:hypothetical protein
MALPFAAQTFDRIYTESALGFQTEENAQIMLRHIFRVLKPGGRYVANEAIWKAGVSAPQAAAIYAACMADFGICQASEQAWGLDEWLHLMQQTGFYAMAADLLDSSPIDEQQAGNGRLPRPIIISDWLTKLYRFRRLIHPRLAWQSLAYRRRLARHQSDGQWLESRLFVLAKP